MIWRITYCLTPATRSQPSHRLLHAFVEAESSWLARVWFVENTFWAVVEAVKMATKKEITNLEPE